MKFSGLEIETRHSQPARNSYALFLCLVAFMVIFFGASLCVAQTDPVRLIPADVPVIAGLHRMPADQLSNTLWLATRNNLDDLNRLVALTTSDLDRRFEYVVVADWPSSTDNLGSHLIVAQGRFHMAAILSTMAHAKTLTYNGVTVLTEAAPAGTQQTARWLAIPGKDIAIFGTPSGVQVAIDRLRSGAAADPGVLERLKNAHDRDQAWSSVRLGAGMLQPTAHMQATTDNLSPCLGRMREVDLGIQLGRNVTIDLHTEPRDGAGGGAMECMRMAIFQNYTPAMRVSLGGEQQPSTRLSLTRAEYDRWLESFKHSGMNQMLEAFISGAEPFAGQRMEDRQTVR